MGMFCYQCQEAAKGTGCTISGVCGKNEQVLIDRCPKGHGLWFDKGELAQVLAKGNFDKERKVIKHLSELFSHKENQGER